MVCFNEKKLKHFNSYMIMTTSFPEVILSQYILAIDNPFAY